MKLQHVFTIDYNSIIEDKQYTGTFTCKKLSIQDTAKLGVRIAQLNGGMHYDDDTPGYGVDSNTNSLNYMIAVLEIGLVNKPSWFNLDEIIDLDLFKLVYEEVASFQAKFRRAGSESRATSTPNSTEGSSQEETQTNGPRTLGKMVEYKVQSSLEP